MPDRKQVKVTMPEDLHKKLKEISDNTGVSLAQMMLVATLSHYKDELREIDRRSKD